MDMPSVAERWPVPIDGPTARETTSGTASAKSGRSWTITAGGWCAATKIPYGDLLRVTGKTARAQEIYQEAKDAFESMSDPLWTARALVGMSLVNGAAGHLEASLSQLDRSRDTFRQFGFEADECWAQVCRFRVLHEGDPSAAGSALADAQRIAAAMGYDSTYVERLLADAGPDVR